MSKHYNKNYFDWQKRVGEFGGKANLFKFQNYIKPNDTVLDFGCGGGYLLEKVNCKKKIGVEINKVAIKQAQEKFTVYSNLNKVQNNSIDVIISNHVLEHLENPLKTLKELRKKLRKGGIIVFVFPQESDIEYHKHDPNQHLFTWSAMNAGNLFTRAGFKVIKSEKLVHRWLPYYLYIWKYFGERLFHVISKTYAKIFVKQHQVQVIAKK